MKKAYLYGIRALLINVIGFGLIVWQAGWLATLGVFLVLWANNMTNRLFAVISEAKKTQQAAEMLEHIQSDPNRFGVEPWRTDYN